MCHFVTLILTDPQKEEIYSRIVKSRHRELERYENSHISKFLRPGEFLAHPQGKFCDCGTALGSFHEVQPYRIPLKEIEKLRKRGWTETKIKRWLQEKEKIDEREARIQNQIKNHLDNDSPDPDGWLETSLKLLENSGEKYIGLLLHWYSGSLESERISISRRKKVRIGDNAGMELYKMKEDMIYEIYR